jgi:hypothetical protein
MLTSLPAAKYKLSNGYTVIPPAGTSIEISGAIL